MKYRTFKRTCRTWEDFSKARKITDQRGLSFEEAYVRCQDYNESRTPTQVRAGTKLEFEKED